MQTFPPTSKTAFGYQNTTYLVRARHSRSTTAIIFMQHSVPTLGQDA